MTLRDLLTFKRKVLSRHRWRTAMLLVAMAIGVLAVNLLTGLGEGAKAYVLGEFRSLGKNTLIMMPGRKETTGGMPPIMGTAPRNLTLADAAALSRLPGIDRVAPLVIGAIPVSHGNLSRETVIIGTHANFFDIRQLEVRRGQRLPDLPFEQGLPVCLIGKTIQSSLLGTTPPLGASLRIGDQRCRVIGLLGSRGQAMGMNFDEAVIIPVATAQQVFNQEGLFRIFIEVTSLSSLQATRERVLQRMTELHQGDRDVTVITQDAVLSAFNQILDTLSLAVTGIGAISLLVAGVLIMNVTLISVSQRTAEIGLMKAIGASQADIRHVFLAESATLAAIGAFIGVTLGDAVLFLAREAFPDIPFASPWWAKIAAIIVALATALAFSWGPAVRAAKLPPVEALQASRGGTC